ncbi:divalent metal ion transporter [Phyllosticta citriasiana]|uniref:Divalent metal ion transporter n=1 Tax=Phyllosticta citriasiana TaxID=595635 RepID=A0ABR1L5H5_9PEZI
MTHPDSGPAPWDEKHRPDPAPTTTTSPVLSAPANRPSRDMADDEGIEPAPLHLAPPPTSDAEPRKRLSANSERVATSDSKKKMDVTVAEETPQNQHGQTSTWAPDDGSAMSRFIDYAIELRRILYKYAKFVGPGMMVAVAYIDPGNYATDVAAGASFRFGLLFIILMSNIFAILLQSLAVKLGSVTGMNLAETCREFCPFWLNIILYFFAESAIIATDIAEVIGTAVSLNLLLHIPLVAGCAISILDVLVILFFYRPSGSMRGVRLFEYFSMMLVLGVVICFCIQLSLIENTTAGEVMRGFIPNNSISNSQGLLQACGILGATVMPHSLYLGSGIIQPRLREFDIAYAAHARAVGVVEPRIYDSSSDSDSYTDEQDSLSKYRPSIHAIRSCLPYSIAETAISLFTFALFVNSAILIVAGAALYKTPGADNADLFGIYDLLSSTLLPAAGTIFALALLLSGTSSGIVVTISGQMISEGQLRWKIKPWIRRLITRSISITPSIIIAGAVGRAGLSATLNASQVALSVILPVVSAPLIYFTCRNRYMTVPAARCGVVDPDNQDDGVAVRAEGNPGQENDRTGKDVQMGNSWFTIAAAIIIWLVIVVMNVALIVLQAMGKE